MRSRAEIYRDDIEDFPRQKRERERERIELLFIRDYPS